MRISGEVSCHQVTWGVRGVCMEGVWGGKGNNLGTAAPVGRSDHFIFAAITRNPENIYSG